MGYGTGGEESVCDTGGTRGRVGVCVSRFSLRLWRSRVRDRPREKLGTPTPRRRPAPGPRRDPDPAKRGGSGYFTFYKFYIKISFKENLDNKLIINGELGNLILSTPWLPELKGFIQINLKNRSYKKFIKSDKSIFGNQIQNVSAKMCNKKMNDDFLVNIHNSLKVMNNLTIWSNLIKK